MVDKLDHVVHKEKDKMKEHPKPPEVVIEEGGHENIYST
jgi:hypothetical protein